MSFLLCPAEKADREEDRAKEVERLLVAVEVEAEVAEEGSNVLP